MTAAAAARATGASLFDLVLRRCRLEGRGETADIGISGGVIVKIADRLDGAGKVELNVHGRLVSCGFVQPHIYLDKVGTLPPLPAGRGDAWCRARHDQVPDRLGCGNG